jgi:hypothetical protein
MGAVKSYPGSNACGCPRPILILTTLRSPRSRQDAVNFNSKTPPPHTAQQRRSLNSELTFLLTRGNVQCLVEDTLVMLTRPVHKFVGAVTVLLLFTFERTLQAGPLPIPNYSFESPTTVYVDTHIDQWQKTAKPTDYDESNGFLWDQLSGLFLNTSPASSDHIDNCDGSQSAYLFAVPQVGFFQDYDSNDWAHTNALHSFTAKFEPGKSYRLTAGLIGGGGGMAEGATLQVSLYYREGTNMAPVVATNVVFTRATFPTTTHLVDISIEVPVVQSSSGWAGKYIGIQFLSTVDAALAGGYWDLDNVRLSVAQNPVLSTPKIVNGHFNFNIQSEAGSRLEILSTTNSTIAKSQWVSLGTVTNLTGTTSFTDPRSLQALGFYTARLLP